PSQERGVYRSFREYDGTGSHKPQYAGADRRPPGRPVSAGQCRWPRARRSAVACALTTIGADQPRLLRPDPTASSPDVSSPDFFHSKNKSATAPLTGK